MNYVNLIIYILILFFHVDTGFRGDLLNSQSVC